MSVKINEIFMRATPFGAPSGTSNPEGMERENLEGLQTLQQSPVWEGGAMG